MLTRRYAKLYWTTNSNEILGFKPGELVITIYSPGGGIAGAPEILTVGMTSGIGPDQPTPEPAEFPPPSVSVEYRVGGRLYQGYHYKRVETA